MGFFCTVMTDNQSEFDERVTEAFRDGYALVNSGIIYRGDISGTARYTHWAQLVSSDLAE